MSEVLVIDDETVLARSMVSFLERRGFPSAYAVDGVSAKAMFKREQPRLVILDYKLNEDDGLELLEWIRRSDPRAQIVMMTGHGDVGVAVKAMKAGARDFIVKPASLASIAAIARDLMLDELGTGPDRTGVERIIGRSSAANSLRTAITGLARPVDRDTRPGVLIVGAAGTGKTLVARALHEASGGTAEGFVCIDCTHRRDDMTLHMAEMVTRAAAGTLVLRHLEQMSATAQGQLLALLDDAAEPPSLMATANQYLSPGNGEGFILPGLLYRVQVGWIDVPTLGERTSDILPIADYTACRIARGNGLDRPRLTAEARARLLQLDWPGNVAELVNCIERAMLAQTGGVIDAQHIRPITVDHSSDEDIPTLQELELGAIRKALGMAGGNVSRAAGILGVSRDTLRYRMEKFALSRR
ncbi:MAG: response regulator [Albidovulum sp.]|uniref:sigma-54-dependent transcriptional regulator n=1 Tax=Albidovulum sp. TaxID=1872424 RepID=UPI003CBB1F37